MIRPRRFIPAGAGNTTGHHSTQQRQPVHPRGRGEHPFAAKLGERDFGSSPRARGTRKGQAPRSLRSRFIPAGAGNTSPRDLSHCSLTVHPRGRGEHLAPHAGIGKRTGSSPRARGTLHRGSMGSGCDRFIPAGAGNTQGKTHAAESVPVHPRGRGEHNRAVYYHGIEIRFIPAGAGNTPEPRRPQ